MSFGIFQFRRGTASAWTSANTVLASGELGLETDTQKFKVGDGTTVWTSLAYGGIKGDTGITGKGITTIARTTGSGAPGTTDTYTITFSDASTTTFTVYNGANGTNGVSVAVADEGSQLTATASSINFTGAGVSATNSGNAVTVTIPQPNSFGIVTGTTGTANADQSNDTLAITGGTGISTAATDTPDGLVITNTDTGSSAVSTHVAATDPHSVYQKTHMYDATRYNVLPSNSGSTNVTSFNALYAALPVNATVYFPAGTYDFASELTLNRNIQVMIRGDGKSRSILRTTSTTANLFYLSISAYYYSFEELGFNSTVTKTAGAYIGTNSSAGDNAYLDIRRCELKNHFIGIDLQGSGAGNVGTISEVLINTPVANSIGIRINASNINSMMTNVTINHVPGSSGLGTCLQILASGALQFVGCDFIGGQKTMQVAPTSGVVSAMLFANCFFDQSAVNTVEFSGTGAITRVKFVECGITNGNVNASNALLIAGTGTGTSIPDGIDFIGCDFYNSFAATSTTGVNVTGCRNFALTNCRISGFNIGVSITPYNTNGTSSFSIIGCRVGPTENFGANGAGIQINAGTATFTSGNISYNDLTGNTTNLVQSGTFDNGAIQIVGNQGTVSSTRGVFQNALLTGAGTAVRAGDALYCYANSLRPGQHFRYTVIATTTATINTNTLTLRYGTANTNADTAIYTLALGTGTALVGGARIQVDVEILTTGSSGTCLISLVLQNNGAGATGFTNVAQVYSIGQTTGTINTTTTNYMGFYISPSAANVVTIRSGIAEVVTQ